MGERYEVVADRILKGLNSYEGFFSREYYLDFEDRILNMKSRIQESKLEGRLLKIGIVGEVKAGKSSFLNALIFDGEDVLPKASTPMTAALTKISYSEKTSATIVFYSLKDWERINSFSNEYDSKFDDFYNDYLKKHNQKNTAVMNHSSYAAPKSKDEMRRIFNAKMPLKLVSCKELTEMYNCSELDLYDYLGKTIELQMDDIDVGLYDYIGANGQYTAIVKHVELRMNNELLKDIEIVDTPGLNDPIISRGETTKQFLRECDVVFLLSYCGQFLTKEDILFMCDTLPNEGIRNIIIVGSKFDSGILDDNKSKDIKRAYHSSKSIYDRQASENIQKCLNSGSNVEVLKRIQDSMPPSYISSMLFSCAQKKKKGQEYTKQERNIIEQLKNHFKDFHDDCSLMLSLSGINKIKKEKLFPLRERKEEIIAERNREILRDNKKVLLKLLDDITTQAQQNRADLQHYDKGQLEKRLHILQEKLNTMRIEIRNIFENSSVEAEHFLHNMKVDIEMEINNYVDFNVQANTHIEYGTQRRGFLGLFKETYKEQITTYSASVSDVISNVRGYVSRCKKYANEEFDRIINLQKLESMVKETVIGAFDLSGKDFNENDILIPLEIVIKRIEIPKIDIDTSQFENVIVETFSGSSVKGNEIHQLKLLENQVLGEISKKIKEKLDECQDKISNVMTEQSVTFVDNIIKQLTSNIQMLRNQIDDKENSIMQYEILCNSLSDYKRMISEMEI